VAPISNLEPVLIVWREPREVLSILLSIYNARIQHRFVLRLVRSNCRCRARGRLVRVLIARGSRSHVLRVLLPGTGAPPLLPISSARLLDIIDQLKAADARRLLANLLKTQSCLRATFVTVGRLDYHGTVS
jgi:hypothetical protein